MKFKLKVQLHVVNPSDVFKEEKEIIKKLKLDLN